MNDKGYFMDDNTYQIGNGSYTFWGQREEPLLSQKPIKPRCKLAIKDVIREEYSERG